MTVLEVKSTPTITKILALVMTMEEEAIRIGLAARESNHRDSQYRRPAPRGIAALAGQRESAAKALENGFWFRR